MPPESNRAAVLDRFAQLNVWKKAGRRAPHKPLLALYALGRWQRKPDGDIPFGEVDKELAKLLREFGPPGAGDPQLPFWHLQSDRVWELHGAEHLRGRRRGASPSKGELKSVSGGFAPDVQDALREDPGLVRDLASRLLEAHFPESVHEDILAEVGLDLAPGEVAPVARRKGRDPAYRRAVLDAYKRRCAVCRFQVRLADVTAGLDAAHIRWRQAGGPDEVPNGMALCALHHKLFDLGCFTVRPGFLIVVSHLVSGDESAETWVSRFHAKRLDVPAREEWRPSEQFLRWHEQEVFKGFPSAPMPEDE